MSANLRIFCQSVEEGGTIIRLAGVVDETFNHGEFTSLATVAVVFDLDEVHRITSYGVREWVRAMESLPAPYYGFVRCRPAILAQFNMVSGFAGRGELLSFYAPFACVSCANEFQVLVDLRTDTAVRSQAVPAATCPVCSGATELDDLPESYFSYASNRPKPAPPDAAARLADRVSEGFFRVEKEVDETVTALWLHGDLDRTSRLKRAADGLEGMVVLVADGLDSVNAEGLVALDMVAHSADAEVFLARVGAGPLAAIAASDVADRLRIVSVQARLRCTRCNDETAIELFSNDVGKVPPCRKCDGPCTVIPETFAEALPKVRLISAPEEVRDYLATHAITPWSRPGASRS